jgi:hypothetical protein
MPDLQARVTGEPPIVVLERTSRREPAECFLGVNLLRGSPR